MGQIKIKLSYYEKAVLWRKRTHYKPRATLQYYLWERHAFKGGNSVKIVLPAFGNEKTLLRRLWSFQDISVFIFVQSLGTINK